MHFWTLGALEDGMAAIVVTSVSGMRQLHALLREARLDSLTMDGDCLMRLTTTNE
jgi:hypothetical protein